MTTSKQPATTTRYRRIALTGFMGSGKSTVGPMVAKRLGWRFIDADDVIEVEAGMPINKIFAQFGEAHFRDLERDVIARLSATDGLVIALGGGAIETESTRTLLTQGEGTLLVHLEVQLATTLIRCGGTESTRPVLADQVNLAKRYERRLPLYRAAHISIPVDELTPGEVASAVIRAAQAKPSSTPRTWRHPA